jgi:ATP/maltotriose-dependent transcriptional regulator MalT
LVAAVAMFKDLGDETGAMRERNLLANVYLASGRIEEARETYDRVMRFFDERNDHYVHIPMVNRAMVATWQGDRAVATELIERLRKIADRLDNPEIGAWTALIEGDLAALDEDVDAMAKAYQRALDHSLDAQQRLLEGWAYVGLADVARMRGAFELAHELLATATATGAESGAASVEWVSLVTHIDLAADERDPEAFTAALNHLLTKAMTWKDTRTLAMSALGYALELRRDNPAGAARLLGLHEAAFAKDKLARRPRHERLFQEARTELRGELGDTAFDEAWSSGAAISLLEVAMLMPDIR